MPVGSVAGTISAVISQAAPIFKGLIFNTAIAPNTDFFPAPGITPTNTPTLYKIYVCLSAAGIFRVRRTRGINTVNENLNSGKTLTANAGYGFEILVNAGDTINFQTDVACNIVGCIVVEKDWVE